ncbi:MCE (nucleomorph) [Bigelowiella natans]|uniref:MCE n=1 Tax=Bigelowiella natans TaxID=227086 RepID=Q3LWI7_BIGNA|nr:MCE [Bigelowiella natans]ABA27179.1 MCE [Bigelowiella natans]
MTVIRNKSINIKARNRHIKYKNSTRGLNFIEKILKKQKIPNRIRKNFFKLLIPKASSANDDAFFIANKKYTNNLPNNIYLHKKNIKKFREIIQNKKSIAKNIVLNRIFLLKNNENLLNINNIYVRRTFGKYKFLLNKKEKTTNKKKFFFKNIKEFYVNNLSFSKIADKNFLKISKKNKIIDIKDIFSAFNKVTLLFNNSSLLSKISHLYIKFLKDIIIKTNMIISQLISQKLYLNPYSFLEHRIFYNTNVTFLNYKFKIKKHFSYSTHKKNKIGLKDINYKDYFEFFKYWLVNNSIISHSFILLKKKILSHRIAFLIIHFFTHSFFLFENDWLLNYNFFIKLFSRSMTKMFKYRIYFVRLYFKIYQFKYFESYQVNFISEKILKMINVLFNLIEGYIASL